MYRAGKTVVSTAMAMAVGVALLSLIPTARDTLPHLARLHAAGMEAWQYVRPGGPLHPGDFLEHHGHLFLEAGLLVVIVYLLFQTSTKPPRGKAFSPLTEKEVQELCDEWTPEPLWQPLNEFQTAWLESIPVITATSDPSQALVHVAGHKDKPLLDFVSFNFLGLAGDERILEAAHATIAKYGVGSCGPRGFYGTLDVHLEFEASLAKFMGTQEAILYSYDLATMPSVIPAFANKKDVIVVDEGCCWALRNGCHLSRARVVMFKHNDVSDLEAILKSLAAEDAALNRPLNRKFILVEGIYANSGQVAPLKAIAALKNEYKYRLIIDESVTFGVFGRKGRGMAEEVGLLPEDVEIVGGSLGNATATIGGFCAGDREIVDHQRLSGLGYCFSASLPPYLATAGTAALQIMEKEGEDRSARVRANARMFRSKAASTRITGLKIAGCAAEGERAEDYLEDAESPLIHFHLDPPPPSPDLYPHGDLALHRVVQDAMTREGVAFAVSKYSVLEGQASRPPPSLRVTISAVQQAKDIDRAIAALQASAKRVLSRKTWV